MEASPRYADVYEYTLKVVDYFVRKYASGLSAELREDCSQDALIRTWNAFRQLDESGRWKRFIQQHCRGAVLDYLKRPVAAEEGVKSKDDPDRVFIRLDRERPRSEANALDALISLSPAAETIGSASAFAPNWELVSRMVGKDENLHIVAKVVLGFTQQEIADQMSQILGVHQSRERVSQRIREFFAKLDAPEFYYDRWTCQCIYALGLAERYHMTEHDNGAGWDLETFDLYDQASFKHVQRFYRPSLFDMEEISNESPSANHLAI